VKVALVALSVRGPMGQYLEALIKPLSEAIDLYVFVPSHYAGSFFSAQACVFETGSSPRKALLPLLNPFAANTVWQRIRQISPDVVHLFNGEGYPWSLLWSAWAKRDNIPLGITVHDPQPHPGNVLDAINAKLRRFSLGHASRVHIHSQCWIDSLSRQGMQAERLQIIPHGSFAERFLRHQQVGVSKEKLVLFFGRLEAYKGIDILIEAGLRLDQAFKVAIAGPGRLPKALLDVVLAHPNRFILLNQYLCDADVTRLFQRSCVCALPYHQATQSSIPLISAALGVPVVATTVGSFVDDVSLVNGVLIPPGDPDALIQGIYASLDRTPYYPSDYEFKHLVCHFVDFYKSVQFTTCNPQ
jgi:glycosyltransferase involved in cell wall biosynthesis